MVVGFLIDLSNSSRIHWKNYQDAAIELVLNLLPGDKKYSGYLISYANEPELQVNTTTESDKLVEKLSKMKPGGGSSLYDAIYMACMRRQLVDGEPYDPRRVLIVIGDGHDNASKKSLDEVIEIAQRNLVTIYGMSTVSFGFTNEGDENLQRLTQRDRRPCGVSAERPVLRRGWLPFASFRRWQLRADDRHGRHMLRRFRPGFSTPSRRSRAR